MQTLPYPTPIKYEKKEVKGDYLNAEVMRQGISLQMTDLKPSAIIESEIFPKELTKEAYEKDVFTPPNHQQLKFAENNDDQNDGFFITEDIRASRQQDHPDFGDEEAI